MTQDSRTPSQEGTAERFNYDALMKQLKGFEEIVEENGHWTGLLKNHKDVPSFFYDQSHGCLFIHIHPVKAIGGEDAFSAELMVWSIDDGSIVLLGPPEPKEKAEKRLHLLIDEARSWDGWIPTEEQVKESAMKTGCYWNR